MDDRFNLETLTPVWPILSAEERVEAFGDLSADDAETLFDQLSARSRAQVILGCEPRERMRWMRSLAPDDAADIVQELDDDERAPVLDLLEPLVRREVTALMAYAEDDAGGLMSPRFVRVRPDMTVDEAIGYVRRQATGHAETIYTLFVLDPEQRLLGVVSFRQLITSPGDRSVRELMETDVITVGADHDDEAVALLVQRHDLLAVPVLDTEGRMVGIVTVDDVVDVVQAEATEDIQKLGGMEALDIPYLQTGLAAMLKKRGGWLAMLFVGELFTASAMSSFEHEIAQAVVLAVFIPLIISSGGNSGSQATTLVIRAMALGEVRLADWWSIAKRELATGLALGGMLAALGVSRVLLWEELFGTYGDQTFLMGTTVAVSLVLVVTLGTLAGSMLPMLLRRVGFDPASASAPFVATLVDVSGLVIYFSVARSMMS